LPSWIRIRIQSESGSGSETTCLTKCQFFFFTKFLGQVVAVGTALPTASLAASAQQGPVMLTAKNLQCMRAILSIAHCHGDLLGSAWHMVLTTLQHLGTGTIASTCTLSSIFLGVFLHCPLPRGPARLCLAHGTHHATALRYHS